jgi:hypothetical protein
MSSFGRIPFYFLSSIILLILALFPFGPWSKKDSNWPAIGLQSLSILQLCPCKLGQKKILLAAGISASTLDIQTGIS